MGRRESRGSRNAFERTVSRYGTALVAALMGAGLFALAEVAIVLMGLGFAFQRWEPAVLCAVLASGVLFVGVEPWLPVSRWWRALVFGGIAVTGLAGLVVLLGGFDFGDDRLDPLLFASLGAVLVGAMAVPVVVGLVTENIPAAWSQVPERGYVFGLFTAIGVVVVWPGIGLFDGSLWLFVGSVVVLVVLSVLAWRVHEGIDETPARGGRWLIGVLMVLGVAEAVVLIGASV